MAHAAVTVAGSKTTRRAGGEANGNRAMPRPGGSAGGPRGSRPPGSPAMGNGNGAGGRSANGGGKRSGQEAAKAPAGARPWTR